MTVKKTPALASFVLAACAAALAAAQANDAIKTRHEAMEEVGEAMKSLGAIAKKQAPFDAAVVKKHATTIADKLAIAEKHFLPGTDKGETHAKPEIWANKGDFDKLMGDAQKNAAALAAVADEAAFRPALGALGTSCKSCHDKYRLAEH